MDGYLEHEILGYSLGICDDNTKQIGINSLTSDCASVDLFLTDKNTQSNGCLGRDGNIYISILGNLKEVVLELDSEH